MPSREAHVRAALQAAVDDGVTPGAVACVRRQDASFELAVGTLARHPWAGALVELPTDTGVHYDLASLTKVLCTTTLAARAVSEGRLSLDDRPPSRWRAACGHATLADLLGHRGGLDAHREFFIDLAAGDRAGLFGAIASVPPATAVGPVVYSDLGFLILGDWLESEFGESLAHAFARHVVAPLGLEAHLGFRDLTGPSAVERSRIAPTEVYDPTLHDHGGHDDRDRTPSWFPLRVAESFAHGRVHDDNAVIAGGVAGHAGLFGTAAAVAEVAAAWLQAPENIGISPSVRDLFWSPSGTGTRRLGWDGPEPDGSGTTSSALGSSACGHLGFTGTSVWVDPHDRSVYVLLTNRVHPTRDRPDRIRALRRAFHEAAAAT